MSKNSQSFVIELQNFNPREGFEEKFSELRARYANQFPADAEIYIKVKSIKDENNNGFKISTVVKHQANTIQRQFYLERDTAVGLDRHWALNMISKSLREILDDILAKELAKKFSA